MTLKSQPRILLPPLTAEEHNAILAGLRALQFLITTDALPPAIRRIHTDGASPLGITDIDRLFQKLDCACSQASHSTEEDCSSAPHELTESPMDIDGYPTD